MAVELAPRPPPSRNVIVTVMLSENRWAYSWIAALIVLMMAADFASPVIVLSYVGTMTSCARAGPTSANATTAARAKCRRGRPAAGTFMSYLGGTARCEFAGQAGRRLRQTV